MKHICVTEIDAYTKILCTVEPMRTGPLVPQVKGFQLDWADESTWPVPMNQGVYERAPKYYGTCDDDADITISGVLEVLTEADFNQRKRDEFYARRPFPSWVFDEATLSWSSPVPYPESADPWKYRWDEATLTWKDLDLLQPEAAQAT